MIVIEGMDNSGKSTLARVMADYMALVVQESEGPPRSELEINERVDKYAGMQGRLFVRHPCVSNNIYDLFRGNGQPTITSDRTRSFYEAKPILIYCDAGTRGLEGHVEKDHDTPEHMVMVLQKKENLLEAYRLWAAQHAHFVYRIGDNMDQLAATVYFYEQWSQQGKW